jgi:23S rRNA pseudouridine2605 synthase
MLVGHENSFCRLATMNILPSVGGLRTHNLLPFARIIVISSETRDLFFARTRIPCMRPRKADRRFNRDDGRFREAVALAVFRNSDSINPMKREQSTRQIGLARTLSKLGYCSRSQAAKLIRAGRVRLNGDVRRDPETPVRPEQNRIVVDGRAINQRKKIYLMMNKSRGLVTTASDKKNRQTVYEVFAKTGESLPWVAPVGRLDKASEGLLLLTNDSEWGARIAAPETHLQKTYHVQIGSVADTKLMQAIVSGVADENGDVLRAAHARLLRSGEKRCWLEIILDEGKNRQIRRMLAAFGVEVLRLVRVAIGPLRLGQLPKGGYRALTIEEKVALDRAMAKVERRTSGVGPRPSGM